MNETWTQEQTTAKSRLKHARNDGIITREQYYMLYGQVKEGAPRAALRGLAAIKRRQQNVPE